MTSFDQQKEMEYHFAIDKVKTLPKGIKVLDAGCGSGGLVSHLISEGYDAWGVDFLPYGQGHLVVWGFPVISIERYIQEDIRKMSFPDKSFDVIYCLSTMINLGLAAYGAHDQGGEWEDKKAMKEFRRILKDKGLVLLTLDYGETGIRPKRFPFRVYDDERIKEIIEGFEIIEERYYYYDPEKETWIETKDKDLMRKMFPSHITESWGMCFLVLRKKEE